MAHRVLIPTPLRAYTAQQDVVEADGRTVGDVLSALTTQYGDLRRHLYADDGKLRSFVNVYVNDDDIRYRERERTELKAGDVISIVPSVAGARRRRRRKTRCHSSPTTKCSVTAGT